MLEYEVVIIVAFHVKDNITIREQSITAYGLLKALRFLYAKYYICLNGNKTFHLFYSGCFH